MSDTLTIRLPEGMTPSTVGAGGYGIGVPVVQSRLDENIWTVTGARDHLDMFASRVESASRGVIRIDDDCRHCGSPVAVLGLPGKGRPLDTFEPDYFCRGHAVRVSDSITQ